MNIKETAADILKKTVSLFKTVWNKIVDFYRSSKVIFILICSIIAAALLLIILLVCLLKNTNKKDFTPSENFILTQELQVPDGPEIQKNYNISRKTKNNWTDEETAPWFTVPSERDIENLGSANEKIVSDIVGAAP